MAYNEGQGQEREWAQAANQAKDAQVANTKQNISDRADSRALLRGMMGDASEEVRELDALYNALPLELPYLAERALYKLLLYRRSGGAV